MSLLAAAIISGGIGLIKNEQAKTELKYASRMQGISNDINKYQMFANTALQSQELIDTFAADESTAAATAAAQNRRGGSVDAISKQRKKMLDKNVKTLEQNAALSGALLDIGTSESARAAAAKAKAGDVAAIGSGIGNILKVV